MFEDEELGRAVQVMRQFDRRWYVAGGWALDLFLGRVTRGHADVEITIFRSDQNALRKHLGGWEFEKVENHRRVRWPPDQWLSLPVHEVHGWPSGRTDEPLEFLLNEREGDLWVYRRNDLVRCPVGEIGGATPGGIPFLRPEIVLLYKAKAPRPVDEQDFAVVHGTLEAGGRAWLRAALELCHPDHSWIAQLGQGDT